MELRANKKQRGVFVLIVSFILMLIATGNGYAQSSKRIGQHNFQLPADWPVEKRGGLLTPLSTEEYVSIKFEEIEKEFQTIKDDFSEEFEGFKSGLKSVEMNLTEEFKKLQSQNDTQGDTIDKLQKSQSGIRELENELTRLEKTMTSKINKLQSKITDINKRLDFIGDNLDGLQTQIYRLDEKVDYYHEQ